MRVTDLFEAWNVQPLLIAIATTGLSPIHDKVLALGTNDTAQSKLIFHKVSREELLPAQKYHMISEQQLQQDGLDTGVFVEQASVALKDKFLLSYNSNFQYSFLSEALEDPSLQIYDLSVIEQAVRKGLSFAEEELATPGKFFQACSAVYYPLPINSICRNLKMTRQPSPGELPLERSLVVLQRLYNEASWKEIRLLQN